MTMHVAALQHRLRPGRCDGHAPARSNGRGAGPAKYSMLAAKAAAAAFGGRLREARDAVARGRRSRAAQQPDGGDRLPGRLPGRVGGCLRETRRWRERAPPSRAHIPQPDGAPHGGPGPGLERRGGAGSAPGRRIEEAVPRRHAAEGGLLPLVARGDRDGPRSARRGPSRRSTQRDPMSSAASISGPFTLAAKRSFEPRREQTRRPSSRRSSTIAASGPPRPSMRSPNWAWRAPRPFPATARRAAARTRTSWRSGRTPIRTCRS